MCPWVCVSGLSLLLAAENAYFALKAYANIWQSGLNLSDCTLDHKKGWYGERTRMKDQIERERDREGGKKIPFSEVYVPLIQRCAHSPRKSNTMSHLNLSLLCCRASEGRQQATNPHREAQSSHGAASWAWGVEYPTKMELSLRSPHSRRSDRPLVLPRVYLHQTIMHFLKKTINK